MKRKKIAALVAAEVARQIDQRANGSRTFSTLSIRFSDGRGIDVPYEPWRPKSQLNLPGRWVQDDGTLGQQS